MSLPWELIQSMILRLRRQDQTTICIAEADISAGLNMVSARWMRP